MERGCFLLRVKKDKVKEYLSAHEVWPEMKDALRKAGIMNYSLFIQPDGMVVGYIEAENLKRSLEAVGNTDVNSRWQEHMAKFFESGSGDMEEGGLVWLQQYFHLSQKD